MNRHLKCLIKFVGFLILVVPCCIIALPGALAATMHCADPDETPFGFKILDKVCDW